MGVPIRWLFPCVLALAVAAPAWPQPAPADGVTVLVGDVRKALEAGRAEQFLALVSPVAEPARIRQFATEAFTSGITRAVVHERDRTALAGALPGDGYRLLLEVFIENGQRGRFATWQLDVRRPSRANDDRPEAPDAWKIVGAERLSNIEGLYRLALTPTRQFTATNLVVTSEDFELRLPAGSAFVAEAESGITALVLLGAGEMVFRPTPATEKGQVRIFAGSDVLATRFEGAMVRVNPNEFDLRVAPGALVPRPVDARELRRAQQIFADEAGKSFALDLSDLSPDTWSLLPGAGDFVAEVRTRRFNTLTYARATNEPEDITLFDRARRRNIALYASSQKLASRGPGYDEDDLIDYDVLDYYVDTVFQPERSWIEGRTRLRLRVRAWAMATMTLKLADSLAVSSVVSGELGRLLHLRVRNQNSLVVNLPSPLPQGAELTLTISYAGRIEAQELDRESLQVRPSGALRPPQRDDQPLVAAEPSTLYSNRTYWYPQSNVSDFATATLRLTVPVNYTCIATGQLGQGSPMPLADRGQGLQRMFIYTVPQPTRYLSVLVSRFVRVDSVMAPLGVAVADDMAAMERPPEPQPPGMRLGPTRDTLPLLVEANPRQQGRGRDIGAQAADIVKFYTGLMGDSPYPSLTIAITESDLPGGHSPAYFVALNQPLPTTPFVWRNDPATFSDFPEFYLAHEIAHQWWGQAVGWENYHEQWLSEGFAQYFSALYAEKKRGREAFEDMLRQFRRWTLADSDQGPVYLGYRLGHIKGETRVFRALVYNKAAGVLHMLRRLVGDELFFSSIQRFYYGQRFRKAGTGDLQRAFEAETGRPLQRFFNRWIYGSTLPRIRYASTIGGAEVVVRFQQAGELFDVPVTVTLNYADGRSEDLVVPITSEVVEQRIPVTRPVKSVQVNRDGAALAEFEGN